MSLTRENGTFKRTKCLSRTDIIYVQIGWLKKQLQFRKTDEVYKSSPAMRTETRIDEETNIGHRKNKGIEDEQEKNHMLLAFILRTA